MFKKAKEKLINKFTGGKEVELLKVVVTNQGINVTSQLPPPAQVGMLFKVMNLIDQGKLSGQPQPSEPVGD